MTTDNQETPILILNMPMKWMTITRISSTAGTGVIAFIIFYIFSNLLWAIIETVLLLVFTNLFAYFALIRSYKSWRMEIYDAGFKVYYRGDLWQDVRYSEVTSIVFKRYNLVSQRYVLYGGRKHLLVILPSNPKREELGGVSLVDWLKTKVNQSNANDSP